MNSLEFTRRWKLSHKAGIYTTFLARLEPGIPLQYGVYPQDSPVLAVIQKSLRESCRKLKKRLREDRWQHVRYVKRPGETRDSSELWVCMKTREEARYQGYHW